MSFGLFPNRNETTHERRHRENSEDRDTDRAMRTVGTIAVGALALGFMGSMLRR